MDEMRGTSAAGDVAGSPEPVVEENGPWWLVFILTFGFLFVAACAFVFHSLAVTFG